MSPSPDFTPEDILDTLTDPERPMNKNYNTFQISKMFGEYQIVLRTDTKDEMLQALQDAKPIFDRIDELNEKKYSVAPSNNQVTVPHTPDVEDQLYVKLCPIHNVMTKKMISKTKGTPYAGHFVHGQGMCFGENK